MKNVVLILGPVTKEDAMKSEKYLLYEAIQESNLLPYYEKLDENLVSQVLEEFKEVLNDI